MNKKHGIAVLIIAAFLILALWFRPEGQVEADSGYRLVMGTFTRIVAVAEDSNTAQKCIEAGFKQLRAVDALMSVHNDNSEISRINRDGYKNPVRVSESTFEVLQKSVIFSQKTDGAFDVTVGPLVDLFSSAEKKGVAPAEEQIAQAKLKVGFEKLKLNRQDRTVKFTVGGMKLDLGGIAKGYAIDKAVEVMQNNGVIGGMVDVGGDIRCFGVPPKGKSKWLIGLQDPNIDAGYSMLDARKAKSSIKNQGELLLTLRLTNGAVATSGDYRRFFLIEGKKYSHIIDTKTGCSSDELTSVTIIAKDATAADALATAVSVMGAEEGLALIEAEPDTEMILISSQPQYELIKTTGAEKFML
jgi:thiamine biosynthesis lipoprotein